MDFYEFDNMLINLGFHITDIDFYEIFLILDTNGNGKITA
jgi:hypothetical protein